ncbi:MAG: sigma-70 family RNA polymerase sigma factor [Ferruginibacter sp.]
MQTNQMYSDSELLTAIKTTQIDDAIKFMYREYYMLLKTFVCKNSGTEEDAQDVFQEMLVAFINLTRSDKFRGESSIKTFVFSLNRNIWLNELKKRGRAEKRANIFESSKELLTPDVSELIVQIETQKQVLSIIEELGAACKKILLAFYYDDLSIKEILATMDYETEQVVRNKKHKCLKQLEQLLTANPNLAKHLKIALRHGQ